MANLKILTYPHKSLRNQTQEVTTFDDVLRRTTLDMLEAMYSVRGWGLAAPQVGSLLRLFVMDLSEEQNQPQCIINPTIVAKDGTIDSQEDCLSFPGVFVTIPRAIQIQIQYQNEYGQEQTQSFKHIAACCVQHEMDHLNGVLIIDYLSNLKRSRLLKKYEKGKMGHHACTTHCGEHH